MRSSSLALDVSMAPKGSGDFRETLADVAATLEADLADVFGHPDASVRVEEGPPDRLVAEDAEGRFVVTWPPEEALTEAEGRLGAHARIGFEFLLAARAPSEFFEGYRPQTERRRTRFFEILEAYLDDSLRQNPYYTPLVMKTRGPAALVYGDDEYTIVAEDGSYRGHGILHWKVKRLVAFALTDTDEEIFDDEPE